MSSNAVVIIGAGLCGSLLAIALAKRGLQVTVYERRPDMRKYTTDAGRSINLALSSRGITALAKEGLHHAVQDMCIPMTGRMVHPLDGQQFLSLYSGRKGEYINSISRQGLNMMLLDQAEQLDNIQFHFDITCTKVDIENATAELQDNKSGTKKNIEAEIIIGTDGAASALRKSMLSKSNALQFSYSQQYLSHGYKELSIAPTKDSGFQMEKNALHIWPRGSFMIIALPNLDGSFTVTMFHPYEGQEGFNALTSKDAVQQFFQKYYSDLITYMPNYVDEYFENPTGTLTTIKCSPWQAYGKALLMGDAAHAVVPFYGQGMNASFEDVSVFTDMFDQYGNDWHTVFTQFQNARIPNANAIADLAIDNFYEMRDKVSDAAFIQKRKVEMQLEQSYEDYFSKYSMVTFRPDMNYKDAMDLGRAQDDLLLHIVQQETEMPLEKIFSKVKELHRTFKN